MEVWRSGRFGGKEERGRMTESARSAASRALDVVRRAKAPTGGEVGGEGKREAEIYTPPRAHGTDFSGFWADFCRLKNSLKIHLR